MLTPSSYSKRRAPPFARPFLDALGEMSRRDAMNPDVLIERACSELPVRFGEADDSGVASGFARAHIGLAADHTRFFDGFALLLPTPYGIGAAVRRSTASESRLAFDGDDATWTFSPASEEGRHDAPAPWWTRLLVMFLRRALPEPVTLDVSIASSVMPTCEDSYCAALCVATMRATQEVLTVTAGERDIVRLACECAEECLGRPMSPSYVSSAVSRAEDAFVLVDTQSGEHLPVATPPDDELGWGVVEVHHSVPDVAGFHERRAAEVSSIEQRLRKKAFPDLVSLRDIFHKDLDVASAAVTRSQRPLLRFLVTENQRVQKLTLAAQKHDWQFLGGLLLMSHNSIRDDWGTSSEEVDFVVDRIEEMSVRGLYGGKIASDAGAVLVIGQPFTVPAFLESIRGEVEERFGRSPNTVLL